MASQVSNIKYQISFKTYAIIVAGGIGTRMQSSVPKQFLLLNGLPVIMHTVKAFAANSFKPVIIIVLPQQYHAQWQSLCKAYAFNIPHQLVAGGDTRFTSVKNALSLINDEEAIIAVHDAVRPLVTQEIIDNSFITAMQKGNAITAVKSRDTVRQSTGDHSKHLERDTIYLVQTPQMFKANLLKAAYQQPYTALFTDDASVVENTGVKINLIEGSHANIKITFQEDIAVAEAIQKKLLV